MAIWDTGYGSPDTGDSGFGSPSLEDSGYGSPFELDLHAVPPAAATLYGNEGGYLIEVHAAGPVFVHGTYRVDLVDDLGAIYPQLEPGCYSAVPGQGTAVIPEANLYSLRFVLPPLPVLETFTIRISGGGYVLELPGAVKTTYQPMSFEVDAIRSRLPDRVFKRKGAPPDIREV